MADDDLPAEVRENTIMIKMIGLDLDGTFLDSNKHIPEENILAVSEALERGICVLPVTGRPFGAVPEEILTCVPFRYCIASGGACLYDLKENKKIFEELIPAAFAEEVASALIDAGFLVNIFVDGTGYINAHEHEAAIALAPTEASRNYMRLFRKPVPDIMEILRSSPRGIEKLTAASPRGEDGLFSRAEELREVLKPYESGLNIMYNTEINIEIQSDRAVKGGAMLRLGEMLGITQEETMAAGDSDNDLEMLETVRIGVAMENANDGVKAAADFITLDNDSAGVAYAIRKFAL